VLAQYHYRIFVLANQLVVLDTIWDTHRMIADKLFELLLQVWSIQLNLQTFMLERECVCACAEKINRYI